MNNKLALLVEQKQVDTLAERILEFIPGARDLPPAGRLALAHISLAHGLDPFLKEVWAIPVKDRESRQVIGFELMIGITGWRRSAHDSGEYWGRRFDPCTDEERKQLRAGPNDLTQKCIVLRRKTGQQPMEFDGYGVYRQGERTQMAPLQCVRIRAERDAMKAAFPLTLNVPGGRVSIVDDSGEIINVEFEHGYESPVAPGPEPTDTVEETQSHPSLEVEISQSPDEAQSDPERDKPVNVGAPRAAKSARIAGPALARWRQAAQALADEFAYYRYDSGDPNLYRMSAIAGQMNYHEISEGNIDAALADLRQHAREQTQAVPA